MYSENILACMAAFLGHWHTLGRLLNVSREWARQIEAKGLRKLRHRSRINLIKTNGFAEDHESRSDAVKPEEIGIKQSRSYI
jgi:hypothetical protein